MTHAAVARRSGASGARQRPGRDTALGRKQTGGASSCLDPALKGAVLARVSEAGRRLDEEATLKSPCFGAGKAGSGGYAAGGYPCPKIVQNFAALSAFLKPAVKGTKSTEALRFSL